MIQFGREYCTARKPACLDDPDAWVQRVA